MDRSVGQAIEEAYALSLAGASHRALDSLNRLSGKAITPSQRERLDLARARLMLVVGGAAHREEARRMLLRSADWRATLELARLERREGRSERAAELLREALEQFRAHGPAELSGVISSEVERLTGRTEEPLPPASREVAHDSLLALVELGRKLAGETELSEVLRVVLHEALSLTGAGRGFLVRVDGERLDFAVAENLDRTEIESPALEVSRTLIREVSRTGRVEVLSVAELPDGHPAHRSLQAIGTHSVICVPIVGSSGILGVIYLDGSSGGGDAEQVRLLELFAVQAAASLQNAQSLMEKSRALETAEETIRRHRTESARRTSYDEMIGVSAPMQAVYRQLDLIVPTEEPVVITGETGTGKDLVARLIHTRGPRGEQEFVAVNCASLSETLLESELFGYERGAFTGADRARPGLFEVADGGTLFMDEIGDMSPRMQADLLRVLQSGEVRRIGGRETLHLSVRVIAATHRNLEERVRKGDFRQDLFYRLNVLTLRLPPLRERSEDIPYLITRLLSKLTTADDPPEVSPEAMARLMAYHWPGNVRELENVLRRLLASRRSRTRVRDLPTEILGAAEPPAPGTLRQAEREAIRRAMKAAKGNKAQAARILGITRATLYAKLRGMQPERKPRRHADA